MHQPNWFSFLYMTVTCKDLLGPYSLTRVSYVPHGVLKSPDDGVQHQFELHRRDGQKSGKAVRVHCLQQVEEVCPMLWKLLKVLDKTQS